MSLPRTLVLVLLAWAATGCHGRDSVVPERADAADAVPTGMPVRGLVTYPGDVRLLPETAVVYVFARRPGQAMPLAVERFEPAALPRTVEFQRRGAELTGVELVARLSLAGDVYLRPGDTEAVSGPLTFDEPATVTLSLPVVAAAPSAGEGAGLARVDWRAEAQALEGHTAVP